MRIPELSFIRPSSCAVRYVGAGTLKIAYGLEVTDPNHPFLVLGEHEADAFTRAAMPGTFLCETIPARSFSITTQHMYVLEELL